MWFTSRSDNSRLSERIVFAWDGGWGTNPLVLRESKQSGDCRRIGMAIKNEAPVEKWNTPEAVANTLGRYQGSLGRQGPREFRVTVT